MESYNPCRFGFNGKEKLDEITGNKGTDYDFGARLYDARVGRWWSVDSKPKAYVSPYLSFADNPIIYIDPDGKTEFLTIIINNEKTGKTTCISKVSSNKVFSDKKIHEDKYGAYYSHWYDKQTTIQFTIDKNGKYSVSIDSKVLNDKKPKEVTSGPFRENSQWANFWDHGLDGGSGKGGFFDGGFYETSPEGGHDPTKFKSVSDATKLEIGDLLTIMGSQGFKGFTDMSGAYNQERLGDIVNFLKGVIESTSSKEGNSQYKDPEELIEFQYRKYGTDRWAKKQTMRKDSAKEANKLKGYEIQ